MEYDVVVKDVYVVHDAVQHEVNIGINGDYIAYIGADKIAGKEIIDGKNHLAVPGWVNTHTHLAMTLLRSYADDMQLQSWLNDKIWPAEAHLTKDSIKWGSYLGIAEMIKGGTTCFNDMYFDMAVTAGIVQETGIRAVLSRCLTIFPPGLDAFLSENISLFKDWHNKADGRIKVMLGPHAPYTLDTKAFRKIVDVAKEYGMGNHIHVAETVKEVEDCLAQHNMTPVAYLESVGVFDVPAVAAHCVYVDKNDRAVLAKHQVAVAHNPQSNLKLASGVAPVPAMLSEGVLVTVGTDGTSSNNNLDMLEEVREMCFLAKGISKDPVVVSAAEALKIGTENGAKALGFDKLGRIETGYKADIALYDMKENYWYPRHNLLSMLIYAACGKDCDTVICNGKVLMRNRELLTIDEEKIRAEANRAGLELVR